MRVRIFFALCICLIFSASLSSAQDRGLDFLLKAEELKKNNNIRGAIDEYNKAIGADPTNPEYVFRKGKAYIILKDIDNAIQCFERTVELKNDYLGAYTRLAKLYVSKNRINDAIKAFDNAFNYETNKKDKVEYKVNIIKILYREDRFGEAGKHIADALAVDPNNENVLYYDGKFNNLNKKYDAAIASMLKATSLIKSTDPRDFARFYFELGYAYYHAGKFNDATQAFTKANYGPYKAKIFEMSPAYFLALGQSYFKIYELDEAQASVEQALRIKPDFSAAHEILVKISSMKTDKSAVVRQLRISLEAEKDPVKRANTLATITQNEFESGNYANALVSAKECLALQPANYNIAFLKALSDDRLGNTNAGIATLNDILKNTGLDQDTKAQMNLALGIMYNKANNQKMANITFKKAEFGVFKYASRAELRKNQDESAKEADTEDTNISVVADDN